MTKPVDTASEESITIQLIERLKEMISRGVLVPGAKLPPERDLAPAFGVSRSSLRHALKAMQVMGVVTQRVGDGTYLAASSEEILREPFELLMLIDGISLDDLLDTRLIVEPELAARAAERATLDDLKAMQRSLDAMQRQKETELLIEADLSFHKAIFLAARNPICNRLFSLIHRAMITSVALTSKLVDWNHTLGFHRPIFEAIEKRRPAQARQKMIDHLTDAKSLLARVEEQSKRLDIATAIQPLAGDRRSRVRSQKAGVRSRKSGVC